MKTKTDWKNLKYSDYPFINLLGKQSQRIKHINGRKNKMDKIDKQIHKLKMERVGHLLQVKEWERDLKDINKVIGQMTKIQKSDDSISLVKTDKYIRGCIRLYGVKKWVHIGSINKNGVFHTNKKIGDMSDKQLCDEFRFKLGVNVGGGKTRFFSDSYMKKRRKRKKEELELKKEYRKKVKEGKLNQQYGDEKLSDTKSTTSSKGYGHLRKRK